MVSLLRACGGEIAGKKISNFPARNAQYNVFFLCVYFSYLDLCWLDNWQKRDWKF
jgi:hypothetical protein